MFLVGDCFDHMAALPSGSVDMVLADLPYGTTQNKWDSVLPLDRLWAEYWRICKPNAAVVLTAAQPFTSALVMSQVQYFKYDWTWRKSTISGVLNAKKMPVRNTEDILVFAKARLPYHPQGLIVKGTETKQGGNSTNYGDRSAEPYVQQFTNYPRSCLDVASERGFHPTQKPVALFEYLIRTYTDEGQTVLDNTAGSGTTAIAAVNARRNWICIERDPDYAAAAQTRIVEALLS